MLFDDKLVLAYFFWTTLYTNLLFREYCKKAGLRKTVFGVLIGWFYLSLNADVHWLSVHRKFSSV